MDSADVLSRAGRNEITARLQELDQFHVDARLVTVRRLDYGLSLPAFGEELLGRWGKARQTDRPLLISWRKVRAKQAAVVASPALGAVA